MARPRRRPAAAARRHPGTSSTQDEPGRPPSDAVVLFDGKDLSHWRGRSGKPAAWKIEEGALVIAPGAGEILSTDEFGDCQLHLEFAAPVPPRGSDQGRGNSGVMFFGRYEIQVLDSFENRTYADGQAAAIYGQYPPLVNASRPPGQWQTYDIIFRAPQFRDGSLAGVAGLRHHASQRRARPRSPALDRRDGLSGRRPIHATWPQGPDPPPGPWQPGAVPQHLGSRAQGPRPAVITGNQDGTEIVRPRSERANDLKKNVSGSWRSRRYFSIV